jgi:hypothetical protein
MKTSPTHGYQAGDEVFNFYGTRTNRFLLAHYGFALTENTCDVLRATIVFAADTAESRELTLELTATAPCVALLAACVVVLRPDTPDHLGGPEVFDEAAVKLAEDCIAHMEKAFPTTLAEDDTILLDRPSSLRHTFALRYRMGFKRILTQQKAWIAQLRHFIERQTATMSVDDILDAFLQVRNAFSNVAFHDKLSVAPRFNLCRTLASRPKWIVF